MTRTGDGGELDARGVAWSGGHALAAERCDRALAGRESALARRSGGAACDRVACIEVGGIAARADVDGERAA